MVFQFNHTDMKTSFLSALLVCLLLCSSCEETWISPDPSNDNLSNFDYLWEDVRNRYSFFELKEIDWDKVLDDFRPKVNERMSQQELFDLMADMLYELEDGHVNLTSAFDRSRNWDWYLGYPANFNQTLMERNYLRRNFRITGPLRNQVIDSVLYVYYASFGSTIAPEHLEILLHRAAPLKGVIIDVRNNGGGSLANAKMLASGFNATDKEVPYARERRKTGPGSDDFSEWKTLTIPVKKGRRFNGNVIVLTNRACYSATTFFAQMMKVLPNAQVLGDQTGGGGGAPSGGELPNGWQYRLSVSQTVNLNGEHIETGVPADIAVSQSNFDLNRGRDSLIEAALAILKNR